MREKTGSHPLIHVPEISDETLHRPELERDACGVGVVAHISGERSHRVLRLGLDSVNNVTHRGALNADMKTGDGAGVTTHLPHKILRPVAEEMGAELVDNEELAVGVFFLGDRDSADYVKGKVLAEGVLRNRGIGIIGWREVPTNPKALGDQAIETMPEILHLLLKRPAGVNGDEFERLLFLARREIEQKVREETVSDFYIPSLSHRLMSYKGFLVATALEKFYSDLTNPDFETAVCLYHQRFSTNTFPTWALAQPFRMLCHNGEINTLRGNRNWLNSRIGRFESEIWGDDIHLLHDLIDPDGSDSASLDSALEMLVLSGRSVPHAMAMLIPPAWRIDPFTPDPVADFYKYHACFCEPWDGPAAVAFTNGKTVAATLDRNGLRPARYKITNDGIFSLGSEVGTCELPDETVIKKGRLAPGEMIVVEMEAGKVISNTDIKNQLAAQQPYGQWLKDNRIELNKRVSAEPDAPEQAVYGPETLTRQQIAHGYNKEEMDLIIVPMVKDAQEAVNSMGDDAALSVLSKKPKILYTYFKQLFAQVTNPPIDPIREYLVMSLEADLGPERNILAEKPDNARVVHLESPFLFPHQLDFLKSGEEFKATTLDTTWAVSAGADGLEKAVSDLCAAAEAAVDDGNEIIVLSDRAISNERVAIPMMMAAGAVHHHLTRTKKRMLTSIIVETGEPRDTHHMACLFGFGATAICPYLAHATVRYLVENDAKAKKKIGEISVNDALKNFHKALEKGVLKIMSKMGISILNSYQGAQIFEAVGIGEDVMKVCFSGTPSQISGVGFKQIAEESLIRHANAFNNSAPEGEALSLDDPGYFRYRRNGEVHAVSGPVIKNFHTFVKTNDPDDYEKYVEEVKANTPHTLHDLFELVPHGDPIPIDEVEPIEDIRRRFTTAAMSLGALSPEAHETLAIAMNRIGGKSDSGEGGEDARRFTKYPNGDWGNSKIKQVASGRFGVHAEYLMSAEEIEIKMAQGAKPGEGGQLPGHKVNGLIARLRHTQPGVTLISPPPHHDIYSIEDLAQLIHDLKEINPRARVTVKLVAETGVGTIAAGVAKANADVILVSGHDGGTGASPISSIKNAGLPWEIGVAETQQVLMLNGLRGRVTLRTDGGLRTGVDIIHAAILGAEEYNFGTIALIAMGCVYVRRCHLNTCPVGVATQDPKYRSKFKGSPDMVVNFFNAVSEEVREIMASLGVKRLDDLIGQTKYLKQREVPDHPKANLIDLSKILTDVAELSDKDLPRICQQDRNDGLHAAPLDDKIIGDARIAIREKTPITLEYEVKNTHRNIGTKLSGKIADHHGNHGLPDGTINLNLTGSAGQSFGTFLCGGIKITLTGEANDYVGKGMCGGEIIVRPPEKRAFEPGENSIIGNTVMYGATGGTLYANGRAGERFCVRNSGGTAVVEGIGDHGCEYMTNGLVVILGPTGKNFGAGMSGGRAFIYDAEGTFEKLYNPEMVEVVGIESEPADEIELKKLIYQHLDYTDSAVAKELLENWDSARKKFRLVRPQSTVADAPAVAKVEKAAAGK
ncbi:MAG: glutamate synthase large subunit [Verrucomicrobiales bacterium]|nr:glutamate synthase large subunit [Verrucomicrobiales bacterium]